MPKISFKCVSRPHCPLCTPQRITYYWMQRRHCHRSVIFARPSVNPRVAWITTCLGERLHAMIKPPTGEFLVSWQPVKSHECRSHGNPRRQVYLSWNYFYCISEISRGSLQKIKDNGGGRVDKRPSAAITASANCKVGTNTGHISGLHTHEHQDKSVKWPKQSERVHGFWIYFTMVTIDNHCIGLLLTYIERVNATVAPHHRRHAHLDSILK